LDAVAKSVAKAARLWLPFAIRWIDRSLTRSVAKVRPICRAT